MSQTRQILEEQGAQSYRSQFDSDQTHPAVYSQQLLQQLRSEVRAFNKSRRSVSMKDPFTPHDIDSSSGYQKLVSRMPGGVIGTLTIPSINLDRQISAGVDLSQIRGVEHLPQTALPADMDGINTVLAGHNGETDDPAFNDLDRVKRGQQFTITTLGKELVYKVDAITTVQPTDLSGIRAVKGKTYATLMTCTPRYINEFRLLVRGRLVAVHTVSSTTDDPESALKSSVPAWMPIVMCFFIIAVFACVVIACVHTLLVPTGEKTLLVASSGAHILAKGGNHGSIN